MRRALLVVAAAATVLAVGTVPAVAGGSVNVERPIDGSILSSAAAVVMAVQENGCGGLAQPAPTSSVQARLTADDGQLFPGSHEVSLQRSGDCATTTRWEGASVDPASPTDFFGAGAAPMCNGRWRIQGRADGAAWGAGASFQVRLAPRAPADVSVRADRDDVTVTWSPNPETDLAGYRVERRSGSGNWTEVSAVAPSATTVTDDGVSTGTWEYRVVALRPDGDGQRACADRAPDLTTASAAKTVKVGGQSGGTSTTGGGSTDGGSTDGSDGDGGSTDGSDSDGGSTDGGTSTGDSSDGSTDDGGSADGGGTTTGGSGGGSTTGSSPGRRVAAPPPATRTGPDTSTPKLPHVSGAGQPRERYYGEDEEYDPALDFGNAEGVTGTETRSRSRQTVAERMVPQAVQELVSRYVDPNRVLKPIAAGLVLVAFALHLRRWSREQHV